MIFHTQTWRSVWLSFNICARPAASCCVVQHGRARARNTQLLRAACSKLSPRCFASQLLIMNSLLPSVSWYLQATCDCCECWKWVNCRVHVYIRDCVMDFIDHLVSMILLLNAASVAIVIMVYSFCRKGNCWKTCLRTWSQFCPTRILNGPILHYSKQKDFNIVIW